MRNRIKPEVLPFDTRRLTMLPLLVFLAFACFFVLLRSKDPFAVDGAIRCFEVYRRQSFFFHSSYHMLYPVNVLIWTRMAAAAGLQTSNPQSFYRVVELMNCLAAAGCLALFFLLMSAVTHSWRLAVLVTTIYGLSRAFLLHATNASEPMVGVFWSFLAVAVAALSLKTKSPWPVFFSGLLFALSMATYQSTVLLGPAALFLIWRSRPLEKQSGLRPPSRIFVVFLFGLGAVFGSASIYGCFAYSQWKHQPAVAPSGLFTAQLVQHPGAHAYFGVSMNKFATVPVGLIRNVFPIFTEYFGLRNLLRGAFVPILSLAILLLAVGVLFGFCAIRVGTAWSSLTPAFRTAFLAAALGLVFCLFPVVTWSDQYDKLWLQPLGCLCFLLGISLHWVSHHLPRPFLLARALPAFFLAGVLLNFGWLATQHVRDIPEMREAQRLAAMIRPNDLVVGNWDGVSDLFGYLWATDGQVFSFPGEAAVYGSAATSHLHNAIVKTQKVGGRVFFLGLLELPKDSWDSFLASRCGVPYSDLDLYRVHSTTRATFETRYHEIVLKQFDATW
ncbi:MAG: hypothetical protein WAN12_06220 [Candidatus Acidiferrum sp.]